MMRKSYGKRLLSLILVIQMVISFTPGLTSISFAATPTATVSVNPSMVTGKAIGDTFTVSFDVSDVTQPGAVGFEATIKVDPNILEYTSGTLTEGNFISGGVPNMTLMVDNITNNNTGTATCNFVRKSSPYPTGSGTLFTASFRVKAQGRSAIEFQNIDMQTSSSEHYLFTTNNGVFDNEAPIKPTGLSLTSGSNTIDATWDANPVGDVVNGYKIYWGTTSPNYTASANVGPSTTSYQISNLTNGTPYFVAVKAYDDAGNYSAYSDEQSAVPNAKPTVFSFNVTPNPAVVETTVTFSGSGADVGGSITGYKWEIDGSEANTTESFSRNNLSIGNHSVSFRVQDDDGAWSDPSTATLVITAKPTPGAPTITNPAASYTTNDDNPITVSGTSAIGDVIDLYKNTSTWVASANATAQGWGFTNVQLSENENKFTAKATNSYDVTSSASNSVTVTLDTAAPQPPTISSPASDDTYNASELGVGKSLVFSGTVEKTQGVPESGASVYLYDEQVQAGTASTNASGSWSITVSDLSDGIHTYTAKAVDAAGNSSGVLGARVITVDATAPTISITAPSNGATINTGTFTVSGDCNENGATVTIKASNVTKTDTVSAGKWSVTGVALDDGAYTITAEVSDAAGNPASASISITKDTGAPNAPVITYPSEPVPGGVTYVNSSSITATGTAEAGSTVVLTVDGSVKPGVTATGGNWSVPLAGLSEGAHTLTAVATDTSQNTGNPCNPRHFTVDIQAPETTMEMSPSSPDGTNGWYATQPMITLSKTDTGSIFYSWVSATGPRTTYSVAFPALSGAHTLYYYSEDLANNTEGTKSVSLDLKINTAAPTSSITAPTGGTIGNAAVYTITGTATDADLNVASVNISINDGEWQTATGTSSWTYTWTLPDDGTYTIKSRAADAAGLVETPGAGVTVTVDNTAPETTLQTDPLFPNSDAWFKTAPQVTLTTGEVLGETTTYYYWGVVAPPAGNPAWITYNPLAKPIVPEGMNILKYYSKDAAGNEETVNSRIFMVDTGAPSVGITDLADGSYINQRNYSITGTASDTDGSGLASVEISTDGGSNWDSVTVSDNVWSYSWNNTVDDVYSISVKATDRADNAFTRTISVTVDTLAPAAPVIITPEDNSAKPSRTVTISGTSENNSKLWICTIEDIRDPERNHTELTSSTLADNNGNWSYTHTFTADGVYVLGAKAWDKAGNLSPCSNFRSFSIDTVAPVTGATVVPAVPDGNSGWYLTIPSITLTAGTNETIKYQWDSTSVNGWTVFDATPLVPEGEHVLNYFAKDAAGNEEAVKALNLKVDATAPGVTLKSPANSDTGVSISTTISAVFSEGMDASTINGSSFTLSGPGDTPVPGTVSYDSATKTATLTPNANLGFVTTYTAQVTTAAKDIAGNGVSPTVTWSFTTEAANTTPDGSGTPVQLGDVTLIFDQVDTEGKTTVTEVAPGSPEAPPAPANFSFVGNLYNIETTAGLPGTASINISIKYEEKDLTQPESTLRLYHFEDPAWVDVTTNVDTINNIITGVVHSLSPFAIVEPKPKATSGGGGGGPAASTPIAAGFMSGKVVDRFGKPVLTTVITGDGSTATPDSDGTFTMQLPAGDNLVMYSAPGYESQTQWISISSGQTTKAPTCIMTQTGGLTIAQEGLGEIFGRVLCNHWKTIPGTVVRVNNIVIPTNPGGQFRFTLVHPGVYTIYYDAPGHAGQTQVIEVKPGQTTTCPTVLLSEAEGITSGTAAIKGKVVNEAGVGIQWAVVRINNIVVPTNFSGEFRFNFVFPGIYIIHYDAVGFKGQTQVVDVRPGRIILPPMVIMSR